MKYSQETVDTSPSNASNVAARIIRVIDIRKAKKREKEKAEERRDEEELRGESRVPTFSNRLEALEIRFGRLMIGGSGRSSAERPRATRRNPVSRPSDSKNEGHGKEIPSW